VFAAPNTNLTGYSWVATYTYDKTLGGVQDTDGVSYDISYGGPVYGVAGSPILSASITINGVTRSLTGASGGYVYTHTSPLVEHYGYDYSYDGALEVKYDIYNYSYPAGAPGSLDQNFGPVAAANGSGFMQWYAYDYTKDAYVEFAHASFDSGAVYSVGAVPEPASWAMMIAGFGLVGTALRRRRTGGTTLQTCSAECACPAPVCR
jgi:hypothetical protein